MPDVQPDLLRAFVAVVGTGSFTAAAGRIGRSQSAVRQKLLLLEDAQGLRVFERSSRFLALTPELSVLRQLSVAARLLVEHLCPSAGTAASAASPRPG